MTTLYAVVFTDADEMSTEHSAWLTEQDAAHAGAELARRKWAELKESGEPFPDVENDWDAMDALRTAFPVRLEVEPIEISDEVFRGLLCERCRAEPITDRDCGLGDACIEYNNRRVVL